jgi:hypothetical protein
MQRPVWKDVFKESLNKMDAARKTCLGTRKDRDWSGDEEARYRDGK